MICPLCHIKDKKEKIYYETENFIVCRTKNMRGHKERIMVVYKSHIKELDNGLRGEAIKDLQSIGKDIFHQYTPVFVIMEGKYGSINDHWHLVATDLHGNDGRVAARGR